MIDLLNVHGCEFHLTEVVLYFNFIERERIEVVHACRVASNRTIVIGVEATHCATCSADWPLVVWVLVNCLHQSGVSVLRRLIVTRELIFNFKLTESLSQKLRVRASEVKIVAVFIVFLLGR